MRMCSAVNNSYLKSAHMASNKPIPIFFLKCYKIGSDVNIGTTLLRMAICWTTRVLNRLITMVFFSKSTLWRNKIGFWLIWTCWLNLRSCSRRDRVHAELVPSQTLDLPMVIWVDSKLGSDTLSTLVLFLRVIITCLGPPSSAFTSSWCICLTGFIDWHASVTLIDKWIL